MGEHIDMSADFEESKLGTLTHWDEQYERELANFREHSDDEGEIWFGEDTEADMVEWLVENVDQSSSVLDLGTGNGSLLFAAREAGMTGPMLGIDYSAQATALAKGIAAKRDKSDIEFETVDFLSEDLPAWHHDLPAFDVILDKGTLDAILLATKDSEVGPLHVRYPHRMARMLRSGGTFLITSCNLTRQELLDLFKDLELVDEIKRPSFQFGGSVGQTITTLAFRAATR